MPRSKSTKAKSKKTPSAKIAMNPGECKTRILLRHVPCEVIQLISRKKIQIMANNPYRTTVSHSEAIYKLILKG